MHSREDTHAKEVEPLARRECETDVGQKICGWGIRAEKYILEIMRCNEQLLGAITSDLKGSVMGLPIQSKDRAIGPWDLLQQPATIF